MISYLQLFLSSGLVILTFMTLLWLFSLVIKNTSIVDSFWGPGFVLAAWFSFFVTGNRSLTAWLVVILVTIWGLRLSAYVTIRNHGKGEDFRYRKWREEHGKNWWWFSYFQTFVLQGVIMWIVSLPVSAAMFYARASLPIWQAVVISLIWVVGFFFETAGDAQLAAFKSNPENKGKLLTTGVWHYTRHPNYFGDSTQWWAFFLLAFTAGAWWTVISPILMTLFLIKVSGVAMLEKTLKNNKPGYEEYIRSTSSFIPWPPKKEKA
jgi:steroid 5-alpha reductase family enzyme